MAVNPAAQFPVYYGNTQTGGQIYVPGNPDNSTPNGAFGPFGQAGNNFLANPGNIFGSDFNGWLDPLNLSNNYAITPLKPPAAPGFSPGTMPTQNFTNNDFGDFNTPSMQDTANSAHPGILVQPTLPAPPTISPLPPNPGGGPPAGGTGLQVQQSNDAQNVVRNSHITGLNPSTISNDYLFAKGGTQQDLLLSGGTPAPHSGFIASLKSMYGQTPNTAISKGGMTVPSSYNTTANPGTPRQGAAPATYNVQLTSPSAQPTLPYTPMIRSGGGR